MIKFPAPGGVDSRGAKVIELRKVYPDSQLPACSVRPLAVSMLRWMRQGWQEPLMIWIEDPCVWPSSESLPLFYAWRRAHGERRRLEDVSGHEFLYEEQGEQESLLVMAILFGWGFSIYSQREYSLHFDDDAILVLRWLDDGSCLGAIDRGMFGSFPRATGD